MSIIKANQEAQIILYLIAGDLRGVKLLRKNYAPSLYGMIRRMRTCPIQSSEILENVLNKIRTDISSFSNNNTGFFTWVMQVARKLAIAYGEVSVSPSDQPGDRHDTAFSLVMHRGFSLVQVAEVLSISTQQVAIDFRTALKESGLKVIKLL